MAKTGKNRKADVPGNQLILLLTPEGQVSPPSVPPPASHGSAPRSHPSGGRAAGPCPALTPAQGGLSGSANQGDPLSPPAPAATQGRRDVRHLRDVDTLAPIPVADQGKPGAIVPADILHPLGVETNSDPSGSTVAPAAARSSPATASSTSLFHGDAADHGAAGHGGPPSGPEGNTPHQKHTACGTCPTSSSPTPGACSVTLVEPHLPIQHLLELYAVLKPWVTHDPSHGKPPDSPGDRGGDPSEAPP